MFGMYILLGYLHVTHVRLLVIITIIAIDYQL